ncbi:adenylate kinase [Chlamydia sp. 17-3921]|uniref:adenylate kinase n=1 Tax=Chlamydia sp. 17-3921 TaxID=2675798 RepID=UPI00191A90BA|nr:adenylate kinase [Chlamydia sp. 17-3921]
MIKSFVYIIMGPPGSGKGTQSKYLSDKLRIPHISSGNLLRSAVNKNSPLGLQAREFLDQGFFVPDELVWGLVAERLQEEDCAKGCIVDGFPRTVDQAYILNDFLENLNFDCRVIFLEVSEQQIIYRICSRYVCPSCHQIYKQEQGLLDCPKCQTALVRRTDDNPDVIKQRLNTYFEKTVPVLAYYETLGKVDRISAEGSEEQVFQKILQHSYS